MCRSPKEWEAEAQLLRTCAGEWLKRAEAAEGASALQHDYMNPEISSSLYATSILVSGCADGGAGARAVSSS